MPSFSYLNSHYLSAGGLKIMAIPKEVYLIVATGAGILLL